MKRNEFDSGSFSTEEQGQENRHISSSTSGNDGRASLIVLVAIALLAVMTLAVFALFSEDAHPVFNPTGNGTPSGTTSTTTTTTTGGGGSSDPDEDHPYATKTDKTNFIASAGGQSLEDVFLSSEHAILINTSDMTTVGHLAADENIYPASMTKVMTVLVAVDMITDLDDGYVITEDVLSRVPDGASVAWLASFIGDTVSVRDLLYGVSYRSGADAVICLVDYFDLSMTEYVALMNEKAREIGLTNTRFGGAIGMDTEENQTTCRDVAAIMAYAMENPLCRELFGGTSYRLDRIAMTYYNSTLSTTMENMGLTPDTVLGSKYTLIAAKSGFEDKAGYCLVSYIKNNDTGEHFVLVTANARIASSYPNNQNTIHDMREIFKTLQP